MGLTGYYQKFLKNYGIIVAPFTKFLRKNTFHWNIEASEAFERLKLVMTNPPMLKFPNFNLPFTIECDACCTSVGAILMQMGQPIAYISKALKDRALFLSTYEKESLAVVMAMQRWRPYLLGQQFVVKTDQRALKFLLE